MPSLADLLNSPTEITYEGHTYQLRQPTLMECGQYQRWLEQEARAGAARATELPEEDRRNLLRDVQADIAAQRYAFGGELCAQSLTTPTGIAKMLSIIARIPVELATEIISHRLREIAALIAGQLEEDADEKKQEALASALGLPRNFFASSSSSSPTVTVETLGESKPSGE